MKKLVTERDVSNSPAGKLFLTYTQYEEQFSCIEQLNRNDCGVDVRRFIVDPVYREDTVQGLAM